MSKGNNKNNWVFFPEKISNVLLFFILLIMIGLGVCVAAFALPQRQYEYIPDYEELIYADECNVYFRKVSTYSKSGDDLNKTDTVIMSFSTLGSGKVNGKKISAVYLERDNTLTYTYLNTTSANSYLKNSVSFGGGGIDTIYAKAIINITDREEDKVVVFREDIMKLTKKEIEMDVCNDFLEQTGIFKEFKLEIAEETPSGGAVVDEYNIVNSWNMVADITDRYHLDYQSFGVDAEGNTYELFGIYGLSCSSSLTTSTPKVPIDNFKFVYIIAKAKFIDAEGKENIFYLKQPVSSLMV